MASNLLTTAFRDYTKYLYAAYWGDRHTKLTPYVTVMVANWFITLIVLGFLASAIAKNDPAQVLIQGTITAVVIVTILTVTKTYLYSRELIANEITQIAQQVFPLEAKELEIIWDSFFSSNKVVFNCSERTKWGSVTVKTLRDLLSFLNIKQASAKQGWFLDYENLVSNNQVRFLRTNSKDVRIVTSQLDMMILDMFYNTTANHGNELPVVEKSLDSDNNLIQVVLYGFSTVESLLDWELENMVLLLEASALGATWVSERVEDAEVGMKIKFQLESI